MTITIESAGAFIIRKTTEPGKYLYHQSGVVWGRSPTRATIYRSDWSANRFILDMRDHKRAGFEATAVIEPVPLEGALQSLALPLELEEIEDEE